jgi:hypothetical protein
MHHPITLDYLFQGSIAAPPAVDANAGLPHVTAPMIAAPHKASEFLRVLSTSLAETQQAALVAAESAFTATVSWRVAIFSVMEHLSAV